MRDSTEATAARSRPGDLWKLGDHLLLCGDSSDAASVARVMGGDLADLVVTDPPYGVGYEGKRTARRPIANDRLPPGGLRTLLAAAFAAWPLKAGGSFYVCAPSGPTQTQFRLALEDAGLPLRQGLAWVKHHFVISRADYHNRHEAVLYGWKPGAPHRFLGGRRQDTVWEFAKPHRSPWHPTSKPVPLVLRAVENSSLPGETVFDGFAGGGTTLVACEETGRRCRAVEVDPAHCDAAVLRWEELAGRRAVLLSFATPPFPALPLETVLAGVGRRSRAVGRSEPLRAG